MGVWFPSGSPSLRPLSSGHGNRKKRFLAGEAYEQWAATLYQGAEYFKSRKEIKTMLLEGQAEVPLQGRDGDRARGLEMVCFSIWVLVAWDCSLCENTLNCTFIILHFSVCVLCYTSIKLLLFF